MRIPDESLRQINPTYGSAKGRIRFSKTELLHIAVAILVLTAAFSMVMRDNVLDPHDKTMNYVMIAVFSFILVVFSFLTHEFGHKFLAQRYNAWSEFRTYPYGLLMALVFSVMGFLFAAPGAVYIKGNIDKASYGKISLAGPAVNFAISALAIAVVLSIDSGTLTYVLFQMLAWLNAFLGVFNMIPVLPFDGSKILAWNKIVYAAALVVGIAEAAYVWFYILG